MALAANALLTLAEAKAVLNITGNGADSLIEAAVNRASAWAESHCDRPLYKAARTVRLRGPAGQRLWLDAWPADASAALTVELDEQALTVWTEEADGDPTGFDCALYSSDPGRSAFGPDHLFRWSGWGGALGRPGRSVRINPYNVVVTYTGGYEVGVSVPGDLQDAVACMTAKLFRDYSKQLHEVVTLNLPSGSVTVLDTALPRRAEALVAPFRRRSV